MVTGIVLWILIILVIISRGAYLRVIFSRRVNVGFGLNVGFFNT